MWHWGWEFIPSQPDPLASEWFGVPYANFYGWLSVIFFYSAFARFLRVAGKKTTMAPVIRQHCSCYHPARALFSCVFGYCRVGFQVRQALVPFFVHPYVILIIYNPCCFLLCLVAIGFRRRQTPKRIDDHPVIWLVPTYFHIYFIAWLFFMAGSIRRRFGYPVSLLNAAVGIAIHQWETYCKRSEMRMMPETAIGLKGWR